MHHICKCYGWVDGFTLHWLWGVLYLRLNHKFYKPFLKLECMCAIMVFFQKSARLGFLAQGSKVILHSTVSSSHNLLWIVIIIFSVWTNCRQIALNPENLREISLNKLFMYFSKFPYTSGTVSGHEDLSMFYKPHAVLPASKVSEVLVDSCWINNSSQS